LRDLLRDLPTRSRERSLAVRRSTDPATNPHNLPSSSAASSLYPPPFALLHAAGPFQCAFVIPRTTIPRHQAPTPFISIFGPSPLFRQAISYPPFFQNSTSTSLLAFHSPSFGFVPSDRSIGRFFFLVPAASYQHTIASLDSWRATAASRTLLLYSTHCIMTRHTNK